MGWPRRFTKLNPELERLLKASKDRKMTPEELHEQRISFVYGQLMDANPGVTKGEVRKVCDEIYGKPVK